MNHEYYLVQNLGTGYGADSKAENEKQRAKVSKALAKVNADIYGFVEIEQGQSALAEIAADLTRNTGRRFTYINDGGSASGSYTKAGYVYCSDKVQPHGNMRHNNEGVTNRKKMQAFVEKSTGEKFIFSLNHFKAKSGRGTGDNADKGDGQGTFNGDRVREAQSVLSHYAADKAYFEDSDILIMGDLNAYAMEDPIITLRDGGMIDLYREFHADSAYSYVYRGYAGYLDHALCNNTLYPQVTGMVAYHINSDESDSYTYDKSNDQTTFRSSDHDPVIVGLNLTETYSTPPQDGDESGVEDIVRVRVELIDGIPYICNADGGQCRIYSMDGNLVRITDISTELEPITNLKHGLYILNIYGQGSCLQMKLMLK
jgi:predicted extracellular nuclease